MPRRGMTASARKNCCAGDTGREVEDETDAQPLPGAVESDDNNTNMEIIFSDEDDGGEDAGDAGEDDSNAEEDAGDDGQHHVSAGAAARARGGGAVSIPDTTGMSPEEVLDVMRQHKRERNRIYQSRSQAVKRALLEERETEFEGGVPLRSLVAIRAQSNGGYKAKGAVGYEFGTEAEFLHSCREIAEYLGIAVAFTVSNASKVHAEPADSSWCVPTQPHTIDGGLQAPRPGAQASNASRCFDIVAKYVRKDKEWRVIRGTITPSGERGTARGAHSRRTAYRVVDLARHVERLIRVKLHASGSAIRAFLDGYVRDASAIEGNMLSRIRREAAKNAFGTPDENCRYLPVLQAKMESRGNKIELSTISSADMRAVLIGVGRDEHA